VNWPEILAGALFVVWPLVYRRQIAKVHDKMVARGADTTRFDRHMSHPFFRAMLWLIPLLGVGLLIVGLTGS
jgi:hypothetical protein